MCGFCGFWSADRRFDADALDRIAAAMALSLRHRGPDDQGTWVDAEAGLALGHRRLSIIDLSPLGHQPMASPGGRFVISYNGEIYNYPDLRRDLESAGVAFRGHSDTEVLLAGIEQWGLDETLRRANGMFAFAVWDRRERRLSLARDRAGKKPLYYGWSAQTLLFGSDLKAFHQHPDFRGTVDRDALGLFIQYGWMPVPYTIFEGVRQLPPGSIVTFAQPLERAAAPRAFWSAGEACAASLADPFEGDLTSATDELDRLLHDAVGIRMVADVPLGALLSGGIDSSVVVALMQAQSTRPVKTFSIGFSEADFNEAHHAKAVAQHLQTEHTELYVTPKEAMDVIPQIPELYSEPFADVSQIPTFIVSAMARRDVTVVLSGDGGDETFAGYNTYDATLRAWRRIGKKKQPMQRRLMEARLRDYAGSLLWWISRGHRMPFDSAEGRALGARLRDAAIVLPAVDAPDLYGRRQRLRIADPAELVPGARHAATILNDPQGFPRLSNPLRALTAFDYVTYMVDDVLVKVDRASMGSGLEVRCPLLDYRVAEFAWRLPAEMLVESGEQNAKIILKSVLARYVPRQLTDRPKAGFGVPIMDWLRGPLQDWAEALLAPDRVRREGFLDPAGVQAVWRQNLSGWDRNPQLVWSILMFQLWHEHWSAAMRGNSPASLAAAS